MPRAALNDSVFALSRRYVEDQNYRSEVNHLYEENQGLGIHFREHRDILMLFPQSTSNEMADLMRQLNSDELLSEDISKRIKDIMSWPMDLDRRLDNDLADYGAIYDSRLGLVNGIDYGTSSYNGDRFAQAVSFDSLQIAFWFHMSSNLIHQDFMQRLMWDPALRTATDRETRINEVNRKAPEE